MAALGRRAGLTDDDIAAFEQVRQDTGGAFAVRMIILDTHVVSEAMKPAPNRAVQVWLDEHVVETLKVGLVDGIKKQLGLKRGEA